MALYLNRIFIFFLALQLTACTEDTPQPLISSLEASYSKAPVGSSGLSGSDVSTQNLAAIFTGDAIIKIQTGPVVNEKVVGECALQVVQEQDVDRLFTELVYHIEGAYRTFTTVLSPWQYAVDSSGTQTYAEAEFADSSLVLSSLQMQDGSFPNPENWITATFTNKTVLNYIHLGLESSLADDFLIDLKNLTEDTRGSFLSTYENVLTDFFGVAWHLDHNHHVDIFCKDMALTDAYEFTATPNENGLVIQN